MHATRDSHFLTWRTLEPKADVWASYGALALGVFGALALVAMLG